MMYKLGMQNGDLLKGRSVAQTGGLHSVSMMVHGKSALPQDKKWPGKHVFNELLIYSHIFFSFKRKVIYGGGQKSMEMAHT